MIELLKTLSDSFDEDAKNIVSYIKDGQKNSLKFFGNIHTFSSLEERPRALWGKGGVYVFMITDSVSFSTDEVRGWNSVNGAKFKDYKKKELEKGSCLYVGSGDYIYRRFTAHFNSGGESTGLKLGHEKRKKMLPFVKVYAFELLGDYEKYSSIIVREIEKRLHKTLLPVAGSSRV